MDEKSHAHVSGPSMMAPEAPGAVAAPEACVAPKLLQLAELAALIDVDERSTMALPCVGDTGTEVLKAFVAVADRHAVAQGLGLGWDVLELTKEAGINTDAMEKTEPLYIALWVVWLQVTARHLPGSSLKYQSLDSFLGAYPQFSGESASELIRLMKTANWMNFLFSKISARKNKGLVLEIIPKFVEGWQVRYITGSGQTRYTQNRVQIYETEGGCKAHIKPKRREAKRQRPKVKRIIYGTKRRRSLGNTGNSKPVHEEQDDGDEDISLTPDDTRSHTPSHDTDSDTRPYVYKPDVTVPPVSVSVPIPVAAPSYPHTHSHSQQNAMHSPHLHRRAALEAPTAAPHTLPHKATHSHPGDRFNPMCLDYVTYNSGFSGISVYGSGPWNGYRNADAR